MARFSGKSELLLKGSTLEILVMSLLGLQLEVKNSGFQPVQYLLAFPESVRAMLEGLALNPINPKPNKRQDPKP